MDGWIFRFFVSTLFSGALLPSHIFGIGYGDTHLCSTPLGLETKGIPDSALSASSFYVNSVGPLQARLNTEQSGGAWCPKSPISIGIREWLQVSFNENETHLITGVQIQGRHANGRGLEYTEEFELEYWREGFQVWRKYYRFDGKTVFPGNSDTNTVVAAKLRPPILATKIRLLPYSAHRRTVCLRAEFLGCLWQGGVVQYTVEQGDVFSEGISLRDESYDGQGSKWDRRVEPQLADNSENNVDIFHQPEFNLNEMNSSFSSDSNEVERNQEILTGGLGQLTDTIEGANSFTMDVGYGLGNGWVGWRKSIENEGKDYLEILFEFEQVRKFSSMDLFSNNYPTKGVQIFSRAKVFFSVGGIYFNGRPVTYVPNIEVNLDYARNVSIPLEGRVAKFIKIQLFFRSSWIVLGEVYFHSEIYDGNSTVELGPDPDAELDFPDTQSPLEIGSQYNNYGSTKRLEDGSRKAVIDSSCSNGGGKHGSPTKITLRSNQLAALDESADYGEIEDENIYQEASTLTLNNSTSKTRNRRLKIASSVWNLSSGGRSYRNHRSRLVSEVSLRQLRLIENLGSCNSGQVHLNDFEGEIACHEGKALYRNCRLIAKTIKVRTNVSTVTWE